MGWLFLILGAGACVVSLHPRWRGRVGWGRTGSAGPLSPLAWAAWILFFFITAASGFRSISGWWGLAGFALVMLAGVHDWVVNSRRG